MTYPGSLHLQPAASDLPVAVFTLINRTVSPSGALSRNPDAALWLFPRKGPQKNGVHPP